MAKVIKFAQQSFIEDLLSPDPVVPEKDLTIGKTLKAARLKNGSMSIEDIAREICAWPYHIKAIEEDRFDLLPGTTYAVGFIRSYANYFKLDAGQLVQRFKDGIAEQPEQSPLRAVCSESFDGPRMPGWAMAVTIIVLVAGTYGAWLGLNWENSPPARPDVSGVLTAEAPIPPQIVAVPPKIEVPQPAQVEPTPVTAKAALPFKAVPHGQKSVKASPPPQKPGNSYVLFEEPLHADNFLPASEAAVSKPGNHLRLTSGNGAGLDLMMKGVNADSDGLDGSPSRPASFDKDDFLNP
jgi:cytoskeleton protein RodZ